MNRVSSNGAVPRKRALQGTARFLACLVLGLAALAVLIPASVAFGAADISFAMVWDALLSFDPSIPEHQIIRSMRLPRVCSAIIAGTSLAICGAVMQGTTNNPLGSPGLLGITGGAMLGITILLAFFPGFTNREMMVAALIGAAVVTILVYAVASASKRGMTPERLVLAGIAVGTLLGAIQNYLIIRYQIGQTLISFTAGSTARATWPDLALITPFVIGAVALAIALSPQITMLGLGEDVAVSLGVKLGRVKALATVVVFVLTALPILVIGPVGFVGLLTPHAVRKLVGVDYRHIIPLCAVYGSVLVVAADLAARLILRPAEVPVGLIFPLIGVPYFIYLARKTRKEFQ